MKKIALFLALLVCARAADSGSIQLSANDSVKYPFASTPMKFVENYSINQSQLIVIWRQPSNMVLTSNPPIFPPDSINKEVWKVKNGKIILIDSEAGTYIPSTPKKHVFPDGYSVVDIKPVDLEAPSLKTISIKAGESAIIIVYRNDHGQVIRETWIPQNNSLYLSKKEIAAVVESKPSGYEFKK